MTAVPQSEFSTPPDHFGTPGRSTTTLGDNLDLLKALFLGVLATAVVYEIFPLPFIDEKAIRSIFDNWVSETIVGMAFWSLFLLMFKALEYRRQLSALRAFASPEVAALLEAGINSRNADALAAALEARLRARRVRRYERSAAYRRVLRFLHYVRVMPRKEEVHELLDYQAQIDVKKLDASYTILQVFLWAIPILGFIGTVLGIAQAVNEFATFIQTAEAGAQLNSQMKVALAGVTAGLGVAFNTTFIALVLVIPVMLLTTLLQKSEEELLLGIEEYCLEQLLPRLGFAPAAGAASESFEEHLHRIQQLSATWLGQFEPLIRSLGLQVDMIRHQMSGVQPLIKEFTDRLIDGPRARQAAVQSAPRQSAGGQSAGSAANPERESH